MFESQQKCLIYEFWQQKIVKMQYLQSKLALAFVISREFHTF